MKTARAKDHWRRVYNNIYNSSFDTLEFVHLLGIGDGIIKFDGGISAICGSNGVGKSTLLDAIQCAMKVDKIEGSLASKRRLRGSTLRAGLTHRGHPLSITTVTDDEATAKADQSHEIELAFIDSSWASSDLVRVFNDTADLEEIIRANDFAELSLQEIDMLSFMNAKTYDRVRVAEIDGDLGEGVYPYFEVSTGGQSYGSESMGLGELSLHLIFWSVRRLKRNSILLLEEPEAHLSPKSQSALMDVLAKYSEEKKLWIILTTHSAGIVSKIPSEHVRLLYRSGNTVTVISDPSRSQLNSIVGMKKQYSGLLIVEDRAARVFAKTWLSKIAPEILQEFDVVDANSNSVVMNILKIFPSIKWLKLIGLLDGDQRDQAVEASWPCTFLPGNLCPEQDLRAAAEADVAKMASRLSRTPADLAFIFSQLEGKDHHDWFEELHKNLDISYDALMWTLVSHWYESGDNSILSGTALAALLHIIDPMEATATVAVLTPEALVIPAPIPARTEPEASMAEVSQECKGSPPSGDHGV
jgi:predicted ATPase